MPDSNQRTRKPRALSALALVVVLVAFPVGVWASHQYADVPDSNVFHGDIAAITDAGITSGCGGGNYCPDRNVTRAEMAAFMNRLGALASNKTPVANATTVDRYNANDLVRVAYSQAGSNFVDGAAASAGTLTATMTAPRSGWLVINANAYAFLVGTGEDEVQCYLQVNNVTVTGSSTYVDVNFDTPSGAGDNDDHNCSTSVGYKVCSAGDYVVDLEIVGVGAGTDIDSAALQVLFTPFNGAGSPPSLISCIAFTPETPIPHEAK